MSCVRNPYWSGAGNETDYYDTEYYDNATGEPCTPFVSNTGGGGGVNGGGIIPTGTVVTGGGTTFHTSNLDLILNSILSGLGLLTHAPYVPTTVQPQQQPIVIANPNANAYGGSGGGGNAAGSIQRFFEQHPYAVLAGGAALVLLLMKPPVSRAR